MSQILIFGDSIAYGKWDKQGGWVTRLSNFIDEKNLSEKNFEYYVYNLGVSGDTTEDLLERFEFEAKQRLKEDKKSIIIFSIGSNDSEFNNNIKSLRILPQNFTNNILKLINLTKEFSENIIFTGLLPIDESKVDPIPWLPEVSYKNELVEKYDKIIKLSCKENKIHFIELFKEFKKENYKNLLEDGVHPNSEGHKLIFEIVKDYLLKNKII